MEIAREAGALQLQYLERRIGFQLKGDFDLVTECDKASEQLIVERLKSHYPSHSIEAEEGFGTENAASEYRWYVDPLDGTTNFAHGYPVFNVTMALEKAGEVICGVVYDPNRNEMFAAELGGRPGADGPLAIGPSTVTTGEPASSCSPGAATEITLLTDGRLRRVNTETGEKLTDRFTRLLPLTVPSVTQADPFQADTVNEVTPHCENVVAPVGSTGAAGLSCNVYTTTWSMSFGPAKATSTQSGND